jgi:hypothetical protein
MALLSGRRHNRLVMVHPADMPVGFPVCGVAGAKVDVSVENDGYMVRRRFSESRLQQSIVSKQASISSQL